MIFLRWIRIAIALLSCNLAWATVQLQVVTTLASPQPLGTTVGIVAGSATSGTGPVTYKFEVAFPNTTTFSVVRDFSTANTLAWTPNVVEGIYKIRVTARDYLAGETAQQVLPFGVTSRLTGTGAVVNATLHPLVALFSAPTCPTGSFMRVYFLKQGKPGITNTDWRPCHAGSMNFYVGGMNATTTYQMNYQTTNGLLIKNGPAVLSFTTGALPATGQIPQTYVIASEKSAMSSTDDILLTSNVFNVYPTATDLRGAPVWYYPATNVMLTRPLPGGGALLFASGPGTGTGPFASAVSSEILREIDLAGNVVRQTNAGRISEQLMAMGTDPISNFHHDAIRLPNGNTIVLASVQRVFPAGTQGSSGPVDIIGTIAIVLDINWQVIWYWNAFDHAGGGPNALDINRAAVDGNTCPLTTNPWAQSIGCPAGYLPGYSSANDWLHNNSIQYLPDGNLLLSLRNQNWGIKIDYRDGTGTGAVLWRLGAEGDFTMLTAGVAFPWFSGQHDIGFEDAAMQTLSVFDNGTDRIAEVGGNSRGQVFKVDQINRTVSLALNADLGVFSPILGSAQRLSNGNYSFEAGYLQNSGGFIYTQSIETDMNATVDYNMGTFGASYRSWRMRDLYAPLN